MLKLMSEKSEIIIGLETHVQLTNLKTKLFCDCSTDYRGKRPNTHTCPVCLGLPGTLPVLNGKAVEDAVMVALALNSKIQERTLFFRKNYFYPDMAKNYQISQYDKAGGVPIAIGGFVTMQVNHHEKIVRIRRLQLEEDPAKLVHLGPIDLSPYTLIDYNRAGISLLEIVTEPDIATAQEARLYLQKLQSILEHLGVSNSRLEGSMRCDANISMAGRNRVEVKNISSFKEVERALNFEIIRQKNLVLKDLEVKMETRHWDETRRVTISLRTKESEEDYRYFPEPNLPPVILSEDYIDNIKKMMPELPDSRKKRLIRQYRLPPYNAAVITSSKYFADFFEEAIKFHRDPKKVSNWMMTDLLKTLHDQNVELEDSKITPKKLAEMIHLIDEGIISGKIAKKILPRIVETGQSPKEIVKRYELTRITSREKIKDLVEEVFSKNGKAVQDALQDDSAVNYLIGQLMKLSSGRVDPLIANLIIRESLKEAKNKGNFESSR